MSISWKYIDTAMARAGTQYESKIQIKSINTAMSTLFTQIDIIYNSGVFDNDNRRKLTSLSKEVLKRKILDLQRYEDQLINISSESDGNEQFYEESTNFEIAYQEALIEHLVIN